jgi:hypothetical protein
MAIYEPESMIKKVMAGRMKRHYVHQKHPDMAASFTGTCN